MSGRRPLDRVCLWRRNEAHTLCGPRPTSHGTYDPAEATCPLCLRRWRLEQPPEVGQRWRRHGDGAEGEVADIDGPRTLVRYETRAGNRVERWVYNGELRRLWEIA